MKVRRAIVLLSGGIDSATVMAIAIAQRFEVYALSFRYGQRHAVELEAASELAAHFSVARHLVVDIDPASFAGAVLTGGTGAPGGEGAPITYVPARNVLFLSHALAWSETLGCDDVFIGANADDASGYPDCRPSFFEAFARMADLATHAGVAGRQRFTVHAPLATMRKPEIVALANNLGVPLERTWSCYFPDETRKACGQCDACELRRGAGAG